jgi:hypothetical protein
MTDVRVELTTSEASRLRKRGFRWLDLVDANVVLHERQNLPDTDPNALTSSPAGAKITRPTGSARTSRRRQSSPVTPIPDSRG